MRHLLAFLALSACVPAFAKQPFTVEALMKIARISEPQLSPDGKTVVFAVQTIDVSGNTKPRQIWSVPVNGGTPVQLTYEGTSNTRPRWTPDGKQIVFVSNRGGAPQIWSMNTFGTAARQVTSLPTGAGDVTVSPDGKTLVFSSEVYPECGADAECNRKQMEAEDQNNVKARVYTSLLYRHWTEWRGHRRKHLLAVPVEGGKARDLTPGNLDVPTFSLGGPDDFAISPDGAELAYVANTDSEPAMSTNTDVFVVPLAGGEARRISTSLGGDRSPAYSADGKLLAWRSQTRAGYESDKWRLAVADRTESGTIKYLTEALDQPVEAFTWMPDSQRLFIVTEDRGRGNVSMILASGGGLRSVITTQGHVDDVQITADSKTMIYTEQTATSPVEIYRVSSAGGAAVPLTHINSSVLAEYQMVPAENFWVEGSDGAQVHTFLFKPADFAPGSKYPLLLLIHGGPQSAWGETFHTGGMRRCSLELAMWSPCRTRAGRSAMGRSSRTIST